MHRMSCLMGGCVQRQDTRRFVFLSRVILLRIVYTACVVVSCDRVLGQLGVVVDLVVAIRVVVKVEIVLGILLVLCL